MEVEYSAPDFEKLIPDFIQNYSVVTAEPDTGFIFALGCVLQTTFIVDSYHTYDLKIIRLLTDLIGFVGSTLVLCMKKW